jgi:hypothetical protein
MTKWFANRGQIIQAAAALVSCILTLISFLRQGVGAGWVIASVLLLAVVAASAIVSFVACYRRHRSLLVGLFQKSSDLAAGYRALARRFPNSIAVASPFAAHWRPPVGQVQIQTDHDKIIDWANALARLLNRAEPLIGNADTKDITDRIQSAHSVLEVVTALCELEHRVLQSIDHSLRLNV